MQSSIKVATDYIKYSCEKNGMFWSRYTPSTIQTLNSIVTLILASSTGTISYDHSWKLVLSTVLDIINKGIHQRIEGKQIAVKYFEGNTAVCHYCNKCNLMPYDYIGIMHYFDYLKLSEFKLDSFQEIINDYCDYISNTQRSSGGWVSYESDDFKDDTLATANNLLIMHYSNNILFDKNVEAAYKFLISKQKKNGSWERPTPPSKWEHLMCAKPFIMLTTHKCIEAISTYPVKSNQKNLNNAIAFIANSQNITDPLVGFLNKHEIDGKSDISCLCHQIQALLKADVYPLSYIVKRKVKHLLDAQLSTGAFKYRMENDIESTNDRSDITSLAVKTLCIFLHKLTSFNNDLNQ